MRWYHVFRTPKEFILLKEDLERDKNSQILVNKSLLDRITDLERQLAFTQDKVKGMEQVVQVTPTKNDIEEEDEGWDEVDENYRIPIISGIKIGEEGQDPSKATPLNIYGFGETGVQPVKDHGPRQRKSKTN